jgi:hypothetical protein
VKLRIRGNSLRLRLRRGEVRRLADEGLVEERTEFGPGSSPLVYALRADDVPRVAATFDAGGIVVSVPRSAARRWASSDQVGIEGSQDTGRGEALRILVEKDFECSDAAADEGQDDAYPNPRGKRC